VWEHKNKVTEGFTSKYNIDKLMYFEDYSDIQLAIKREKRLKEWPRQYKINLIEKDNPQWIDLYDKVHY
jgi:putative endonuclease